MVSIGQRGNNAPNGSPSDFAKEVRARHSGPEADLHTVL
jgi:hypothetical protein